LWASGCVRARETEKRFHLEPTPGNVTPKLAGAQTTKKNLKGFSLLFKYNLLTIGERKGSIMSKSKDIGSKKDKKNKKEKKDKKKK
jgi:hypothetical protein